MKSLKLKQMCELNSEETTVILFKNLQLSMKSTKKKKLILNNEQIFSSVCMILSMKKKIVFARFYYSIIRNNVQALIIQICHGSRDPSHDVC